MRISKSGANLREQGALVNSAGLVVVLAVQNKKVACTHDDESRLISKHDISRREWTHSALWFHQTAVWNQTAMFHQAATAIRTHPQTRPQCWIFSTVSNERRRPAHVLLVCARSTGAIKPLDQSCIPGRPKPFSQCQRPTQGRGSATSSRENARHKTKECRCGQREALRTYFSSAALRRPCSRRRMA